jgi:phosphoribosylanthranilate isomerase
MSRVKICGLTDRRDLDAVVAAGADAIGVTVDVPVETPREIDQDFASDLVAATPPFVTTVLVMMPETIEGAIGLAESVQPDAIQVHGGLSPEDMSALSESTRSRVIRAVSPEDAVRHDASADALLVDSLDEAGGGGTGEAHDWDRTRDLVETLSSPVILAGGLTPKNVAEAVETVRPFAVDVASGVEARPGSKDHDAVESFIERAGGRP